MTSPSGSRGAGSFAGRASSSVGASSSAWAASATAAVFSSTPQFAQKLASLAWNAPQFAQVPPTPGWRISWTRPATPSSASRERISLSVAINASSLARTQHVALLAEPVEVEDEPAGVAELELAHLAQVAETTSGAASLAGAEARRLWRFRHRRASIDAALAPFRDARAVPCHLGPRTIAAGRKPPREEQRWDTGRWDGRTPG